ACPKSDGLLAARQEEKRCDSHSDRGARVFKLGKELRCAPHRPGQMRVVRVAGRFEAQVGQRKEIRAHQSNDLPRFYIRKRRKQRCKPPFVVFVAFCSIRLSTLLGNRSYVSTACYLIKRS